MSDKAYQQRELTTFLNSKQKFFNTVKDFSESLENMDIHGQIEWIENGTYGAGACYALQRALKSLNNRTNDQSRIGAVILHAFYGTHFRHWQKLSDQAKLK